MINALDFPKSVEAATSFTGRAGVGGPDAGEELSSGEWMHEAFDLAADDLLKRFWAGQLTADQALRLVLVQYPQLLALLRNAPNWRALMPDLQTQTIQ